MGTIPDPGRTASDVVWDLDPLIADWGQGRVAIDAMLDRANKIADELAVAKGQIALMDSPALAAHMQASENLGDLVGRAHCYAALRFATDTLDEAKAALLQHVRERETAIETKLLFFELEWTALDEERAEKLLSDPLLDFCRHHLRTLRRYRDHLLSEPEERILAEKSVTGRSAWSRLFDELTSAITVELPGSDGDGDTRTASLEEGLSLLESRDRDLRKVAADAVSAGLAPGLRTRAFVFNTLLADKATNDRLRDYPHWLASRNLANEASDESVQALVDAVVDRYDIPQRWYALKARLLGVDKLADYDRIATVSGETGTSDGEAGEATVGWEQAKAIVLDAYRSFSPELADAANVFFSDCRIDAPMRPGKRPGAFCAYTVPSHHPYVFLNWTARQRDVLTLAHELGHALHAQLARPQGMFHQATPLTLAETASVFGETVTFGHLLDATSDPEAKLALLARSIDGTIATVFRQTAMNLFEDAVHTARRNEGEIPTDQFGELWIETQSAMLGDAVELTDGYRTWWSYIPHFIATPGYVYAYSYGQLLALAIYRRYTEEGPSFVPAYLKLLAAGGSLPPEELARIVGIDLRDPGFWSGGLDIIQEQLEAAQTAASAAGRL